MVSTAPVLAEPGGESGSRSVSRPDSIRAARPRQRFWTMTVALKEWPRVELAVCYAYSPHGEGPVCERSRLLRALLKRGNRGFVHRYARRVRYERDAGVFADVFDGAALLVPVPGSTPWKPGMPWIADRLAQALLREGLGNQVWRGLRRAHAVHKSAISPAGHRPSVLEHYASFEVGGLPPPPRRIVLVDDIVTKGRTLFAAASRVREAFPLAAVQAFALVRTLERYVELRCLLRPCRGEIRWTGTDTRVNVFCDRRIQV